MDLIINSGKVYKDVKFITDYYIEDDSLFVQIVNKEYPCIAIITKCLCDKTLKPDESYIDTNNCPWAPRFIEENDLGYFTGKVGRSGYCEYPVYRFTYNFENK